MKQFVFAIFAFLTVAAGFSQKIKKVTATYTFYAPETMSIEEAKRTAIDRAKIQALADEFGTVVSQTTSTRVTNNDGDSKIDMLSTGQSEVKGIWVETIGEPKCEISYVDDALIVTAKISGKAKALYELQIPLDVKVLRNGTDSRCEDDSFRDNDDLFLSFQSPVDGSLLVYLVDHTTNNAYCLLPYGSSSQSCQSIKQNQKYVFFSPDHADYCDNPEIDEYTLTCSNSAGIEHNDIIVFFSSDALVKTNTSTSGEGLPRSLSLKEFNAWKAKLLGTSSDIQIINKPITITN